MKSTKVPIWLVMDGKQPVEASLEKGNLPALVGKERLVKVVVEIR